MYQIANPSSSLGDHFWRWLSPLLLLLLMPVQLHAIDVRAARHVSILPGETIRTNLYVAGGDVSIAGRVEGDLTVGGGDIYLTGAVLNDVTVGGGQVRFDGQIGGDLRIAGGQVFIGGKINGDLVLAGGRVRILPSAVVGGDVVLAGGTVVIEGALIRSLKAVAGDAFLNGTVSGPVNLRSGTVGVGEHANLEAAFDYFAPNEAVIDKAARIKGPVAFHMTSGMDQTWFRLLLRRMGVAFFLLRFTMTLVAGLLGFFLLRRQSQELVEYALSHFGLEFIRGFVLFFVIPPAIFLIAITIVGAPVAFLGGLFHLSVGVVAVIYAGIALGTLLFAKARKSSQYQVTWQAVIVGIVLGFLVRIVPYVGFFFNAVFFLVIFGSLYERFWLLVRPPKTTPS
jgi:cytoskeletal protein CcmA (bactofilin family)